MPLPQNFHLQKLCFLTTLLLMASCLRFIFTKTQQIARFASYHTHPTSTALVAATKRFAANALFKSSVPILTYLSTIPMGNY